MYIKEFKSFDISDYGRISINGANTNIIQSIYRPTAERIRSNRTNDLTLKWRLFTIRKMVYLLY